MGVGGFGQGRRFEEQYHCYSVSFADKSHLEVSTVLYLAKLKTIRDLVRIMNFVRLSLTLPLAVVDSFSFLAERRQNPNASFSV